MCPDSMEGGIINVLTAWRMGLGEEVRVCV